MLLRAIASIVSVLAIIIESAGAAKAQPPQRSKHLTPQQSAIHGAMARGSRKARTKTRASRASAAREAARLGALVGGGCNGRAAMQRDEQQWVVLCSNGRTYLVDIPPRGAPAIECSLAANGREPACFAW